jgi:hypothetical protein
MKKSSNPLLRTAFLASLSLLMTVAVCAMLTFALFVNQVDDNTVKIQAGDLKITAEYATLTGTFVDADAASASYGKLIPIPAEAQAKNVALTDAEESIFVIDNAVPTLTQTATLKLQNAGSVAFEYEIRICDFAKLNNSEADTALSEQIQITISDGTTTTTFILADYEANTSVFAPGEMLPGAAPVNVTVTATFLNDADVAGIDNMEAATGGVSFDITIIATQAVS